jgi:hypothetical protein
VLSFAHNVSGREVETLSQDKVAERTRRALA